MNTTYEVDLVGGRVVTLAQSGTGRKHIIAMSDLQFIDMVEKLLKKARQHPGCAINRLKINGNKSPVNKNIR